MTTTHPTSLGPRQHHAARKEANMVAARANGVLEYLRSGAAFAISDDDEAKSQLQALVTEAQGLIDLFDRASGK